MRHKNGLAPPPLDSSKPKIALATARIKHCPALRAATPAGLPRREYRIHVRPHPLPPKKTRQAAGEPNVNISGPGGRMEDGNGSQAPITEPTTGSVAPHAMPRKGPFKLTEAGPYSGGGGGGGRGDGCAGGDAVLKSVSSGLPSRRFTDGEIMESGSCVGAGAPIGAAAEVPLQRGVAASGQRATRDTCELVSSPCVLCFAFARAARRPHLVVMYGTSACRVAETEGFCNPARNTRKFRGRASPPRGGQHSARRLDHRYMRAALIWRGHHRVLDRWGMRELVRCRS